MKNLRQKFAAIIVLLGSSIIANATTYTVDNKDGSGAIYTVIQDAINAASPGDTLIIAGSETDYAGFTLNKKLVIIGAGYNPSGKAQFAFPTSINSTITLRRQSDVQNLNASGSYIEGIKFGGAGSQLNLGVDSDDTLKNITIVKCYLGMDRIIVDDIYGLLLYNNIVHSFIQINNNTSTDQTSTSWDVVRNIAFFNNIFIAESYSWSLTTSGASASGYIVSNNIFTAPDNTFKVFSNGPTKNVVFTNNIIYGMKAGDSRSDCDFCTLTNNLIYSDQSVSMNFSGTSSIGNNIENVDPKFTDASAFAFDYAYDYRLQDGSPAKGAGTDGTEIGIYGGPYPFPIGGESPYITSPAPQLPSISEYNIETAAVPSGGSIDINFKANISNNQ